MAHHVEPMDIDNDFDDKENSSRHNNVLPFTEKGYEELDVSELNMKLRYSITPASSPMSKSYTANCLDSRSLESGDDSLNITINENVNLTRSLNSTMTKNDNIVKSLKTLPLKTINTEHFVDSNRNNSVLRPLESTTMPLDNGNINVTVSPPSDIDETLSVPSSSSSALQTPEATTPTKDIPVKDGGSPIMRGLKSVFSMFRSSQSPIPPADNETTVIPNALSPVDEQGQIQPVLASTPVSTHRKKETSPTKMSSPQKENTIVFNEDLEKELQWKDETTIIFSQERIPIHKLMFQQQPGSKQFNTEILAKPDLNSSAEYMDISNDSIRDSTLTDIRFDNKHVDSTFGGESDGEFVDCETTFTKTDGQVIEDADKTPIVDTYQELNLTQIIESSNDSGSRLKQIILDTTQDILNATLSVKPEDKLPIVLDQSKEIIPTFDNDKIIEISQNIKESPTSQLHEAIVSENLKGHSNSYEISNLTSATVAADQTFNTTPSDITNVQNKQIDVTATENTSLNLNMTHNEVEVRDSFNVTKTEETNSNLNMTQNKVEVRDSLNTTNTEETSSNINMTQNVKETIESLNVTNMEKTSSILNTTQNEEVVTESLNSTKLNDDITQDINNFYVTVTSVTDHVVNKVDIDQNKLDLLSAPNAADLPQSPSLSPASPQQTIDNSPSTMEIETKRVLAPVTELPVNIPLPDEDDLDKESILPGTELVINLNLPLDIEDNTQLAENSNNYATFTSENSEPSALTSRIEDSDINSQKVVLHSSQNEGQSVENIEVQEPTTAKETAIKILSEVSCCSSYELVTKCENRTDVKVENDITISKDKGINVIANVPSTDALTPCSDVVNQTATKSNTENKESSVITPVASDFGAISEEIDIMSKTINNLECRPQTSIETETHPVILTNKDNEEMPVISDAETHMTNSPSNEVIGTITVIESGTDPIEIKETQIMSNNAQTATENVMSGMEDKIVKSIEATEEEVLLSGNNSPFTLVAAECGTDGTNGLKNNEESFTDKAKLVHTPPGSPPITSKGYNFNFDDLDFDPFTTKTNIRMSPPFDSPKNIPQAEIRSKSAVKPIPKKDNRRKTQCDRKRATTPKRNLNSTFVSTKNENVVDTHRDMFNDDSIKDIQINLPKTIDLDVQSDTPDTIGLNPNNVIIDESFVKNVPSKTEENEINVAIKYELKSETEPNTSTECNKSSMESNLRQLQELKDTSSSDLSPYCTASDSSVPSKNVFNLPEIEDVNFNPFATKSKMPLSPLPISNEDIVCSPTSSEVILCAVEYKTNSSEDKIDTELIEKDASGDLSHITASSKATDERNDSAKEINTEDEDTVEGPFLEADDLNPDDKLSDFEGDIDMMQFHELPTQTKEENLDNGEMFIDAEAFEFLLNQNKTNTIADSGKESLFLKFDPLFAKRMSSISSDSVVASLAKLQKRQSTPTKAEQISPNGIPVAGSSNLNVTQDVDISSEDSNDDINITISKPMMVVPPAVNPVTPRNKSITPNRSNRRSITFTSPAMAVIDRLLSLSGNGNNSQLYDTTVTQVSREQHEADIALSQLRELLAEKEINVYNLRSESNELRDRLSTLESHMKNLEIESQDRLKKINQLNDTLAEKTKVNRSMAAVVEEYERTIASLIAETAQDKKRHAEERMRLINERDEQTAHLASMEVSFSDLHSKYEKSKQIILNCKANEETFKKSIKEFEENFAKMQNNYELLKQHATSKLNHANQEMEKINRAHEAEVLKLNAMMKRKELHITSLEESLIQKTKANEELTAICDELINKVG